MACGSCQKNAERVIEQKPKIVIVDRKNAQRVIEQKPKIVIVDRKNPQNKKIAPNINKKIKLFM